MYYLHKTNIDTVEAIGCLCTMKVDECTFVSFLIPEYKWIITVVGEVNRTFLLLVEMLLQPTLFEIILAK